MTNRKNQKNMTAQEWNDFIDAVNQTHGIGIPPPPYRTFVKIHVNAMSMAGMAWSVHTMPSMGVIGKNFLSWHRWFLVQFEKRLQVVHPNVFIPYWNAMVDRAIPPQLATPALLSSWGVQRGVFDASQISTNADLTAINSIATFTTFQNTLEGAIHGGVHMAVGGDMAGNSSPTDPLFWLHHCHIDRIWATWQKTHNSNPSNMNEVLKPSPMFGKKVSQVQNIQTLGYKYI